MYWLPVLDLLRLWFTLIIYENIVAFIVQDQFFDYMMAEAVKQDIRVLIENKSKFLLVSCLLLKVM